MSKILVAGSTNSGSTAEVAQAVVKVLNLEGHTAEFWLISEIQDISDYDSIVVGAPMIFGWHNPARRFVRRHRKELAQKKTAFFACAMRLTAVPGDLMPQVPLTFDPNLVSAPLKEGSLSVKERFTSTAYYLKPMLQAAPEVKPLGTAFFKGKLDMMKLKWWQAAFVMLIVQASPGDYRDWDFIESWAKSLSKIL